MLASFQAKDLRVHDEISVQTLTGKHTGKVSSAPRRTQEVYASFAVSLDCEVCASRHAVTLPAHRLVHVERKP